MLSSVCTPSTATAAEATNGIFPLFMLRAAYVSRVDVCKAKSFRVVVVVVVGYIFVIVILLPHMSTNKTCPSAGSAVGGGGGGAVGNSLR